MLALRASPLERHVADGEGGLEQLVRDDAKERKYTDEQIENAKAHRWRMTRAIFGTVCDELAASSPEDFFSRLLFFSCKRS